MNRVPCAAIAAVITLAAPPASVTGQEYTVDDWMTVTAVGS